MWGLTAAGAGYCSPAKGFGDADPSVGPLFTALKDRISAIEDEVVYSTRRGTEVPRDGTENLRRLQAPM